MESIKGYGILEDFTAFFSVLGGGQNTFRVKSRKLMNYENFNEFDKMIW